MSDWAAWAATKDEAHRREWDPFALPSGPRGGRAPTVYAADKAHAEALWARLYGHAG